MGLDENTTAVGIFTAADQNEGDELTYSLTGADKELFDIATDGSVTFIKAPNYEVDARNYAINVVATDNNGLFSIQALTINVNDVNDNAPVITAESSHTTAENTNLVTALTSTDADTVGTIPAIFSISGGDDQNFFEIKNGNLQFKTTPNYEDYKHIYTVDVTANDGVYNTAKTLTVNLSDVNEAPTAVTLSNQVTSTAENGAATKVADIGITDDALGSNTLSLSGTDSNLFEIKQGTSANELWFKGGANYESAKTNYAVTVNVDDSTVGTTPDASASFNLAITNVNETPDTTPVSISTVENAAILIPIIPEYVTDVDAGDVLSIDAWNNNVTLKWATDSLSNTLINPVTKATVDITKLVASITKSSDGNSLLISPPAELDWMTTGQKIVATTQYSVKDSGGLTSQSDLTLNIVGSTADKGKNLSGTNGADTLVGTIGEDVLQGGNGNDKLTGDSATDALYGGNGDDNISGGSGIDYLYGDNGNDTMDGGSEADVIFGGKGSDLLTGGLGGDHFVFEPQLGTDKITDFKLAQGDKLHFVDFGLTADSIRLASKAIDIDSAIAGNDAWLISLPGGTVTVCAGVTIVGSSQYIDASAISLVLPA